MKIKEEVLQALSEFFCTEIYLTDSLKNLIKDSLEIFELQMVLGERFDCSLDAFGLIDGTVEDLAGFLAQSTNRD